MLGVSNSLDMGMIPVASSDQQMIGGDQLPRLSSLGPGVSSPQPMDGGMTGGMWDPALFAAPVDFPADWGDVLGTPSLFDPNFDWQGLLHPRDTQSS